MERMQKPRDILNWLALFLSKSENPLIAQNARERLCVSKPEPPVNCQLLWQFKVFSRAAPVPMSKWKIPVFMLTPVCTL